MNDPITTLALASPVGKWADTTVIVESLGSLGHLVYLREDTGRGYEGLERHAERRYATMDDAVDAYGELHRLVLACRIEEVAHSLRRSSR